MRRGIETNFKGFKAIGVSGELVGPWNPGCISEVRRPVWELVKALSTSPELAEARAREVAILVTGAQFRSAYEIYATCSSPRPVDCPTKDRHHCGRPTTERLSREEAVAYDVAAALVQADYCRN